MEPQLLQAQLLPQALATASDLTFRLCVGSVGSVGSVGRDGRKLRKETVGKGGKGLE